MSRRSNKRARERMSRQRNISVLVGAYSYTPVQNRSVAMQMDLRYNPSARLLTSPIGTHYASLVHPPIAPIVI
jgi:hypothetical protein